MTCDEIQLDNHHNQMHKTNIKQSEANLSRSLLETFYLNKDFLYFQQVKTFAYLSTNIRTDFIPCRFP